MATLLPDVLEPNLKAIFCGTAVGTKSALARAYYANPSNRFWTVLFKVGLTSRKLQPTEFKLLLQYGIGLTDLVKNVAGNDSILSQDDFGIDGFTTKMKTFEPRTIAFNGKKAAQQFYGTKTLKYGLQPDRLNGLTSVFILPSTSGAAGSSWDEAIWKQFAEFIESKPKAREANR